MVMLISLGGPALGLALCLLVSKKFEIFCDFLGPAMYVPFTVSSLTMMFTSSFNVDQGKNENFALMNICFILYFLYIGFMNSGFLFQMLARVTVHQITLVTLQIGRMQNDSHDNTGIFFSIFILIYAEFVFYLQLKAQAKLFLSMKVTGMQQKQMFNLLDTVPDKVLICSQAKEKSRPEAIYSNRQMNEFFGKNLVANADPTDNSDVIEAVGGTS